MKLFYLLIKFTQIKKTQIYFPEITLLVLIDAFLLVIVTRAKIKSKVYYLYVVFLDSFM